MTTEEFSDQFDVLLNSYYMQANFNEDASNATVYLNEYEKSVFLTDAQEQLIISYYSGRALEGFEKTEEVRKYLDELVIDYTSSTFNSRSEYNNFKTTKLKLPDDCWFIIWEGAKYDTSDKCLNKEVEVTPIEHDNIWRLISNPFKGVTDKRILRLNIEGNNIELISKYDLKYYHNRYIKSPSPIILIDLPEGLKIEGSSIKTDCHLSEVLHSQILDLAVKNAIQSKSVTQKSNNK